jgi:hypothetical protein
MVVSFEQCDRFVWTPPAAGERYEAALEKVSLKTGPILEARLKPVRRVRAI